MPADYTTLQMHAVQTSGLTEPHLVLANTRENRQQYVSTSWGGCTGSSRGSVTTAFICWETEQSEFL